MLPKWLAEELEKMEKKRQKTLAKEAEQLSRQRGADGKERPAWRDEDSDPEEDETATAPALWENRAKASKFRQSLSPASSVRRNQTGDSLLL